MANKFRENSFTLEDFLTSFEAINKMGGISSVAQMLPGMGIKGMGAIKEDDINQKWMVQMKAIIQSMTKRERLNPQIINFSRKQRIAKGSGTTIQDVNRLLKQFEQNKKMMKQMKNNKMFRF